MKLRRRRASRGLMGSGQQPERVDRRVEDDTRQSALSWSNQMMAVSRGTSARSYAADHAPRRPVAALVGAADLGEPDRFGQRGHAGNRQRISSALFQPMGFDVAPVEAVERQDVHVLFAGK